MHNVPCERNIRYSTPPEYIPVRTYSIFTFEFIPTEYSTMILLTGTYSMVYTYRCEEPNLSFHVSYMILWSTA